MSVDDLGFVYMKKKTYLIAALLIGIAMLTVLSGCDNYSDYEITSTPRATQAATPDEAPTVAPTVDPSASTTDPSAAVKLISEWDAQMIALDHARLSDADVDFTRCELVTGNGYYLYDMEFTSGEYIFTFKVNGVDGSIVAYDRISYFEQ